MALVDSVPTNVRFGEHCQLIAYPPDNRTEGSGIELHDARDVRVALGLFAHKDGSLSFVLDKASPHFTSIVTGQTYIEFWRCGRYEAVYRVERRRRARDNSGFVIEGAVEIECLPAAFELDGIRILGNTSDEVEFTGHADDAIKDAVRYQVVSGTAYNDPGGNARSLSGWQVAANKSEAAAGQTLTARGEKLLDKLYSWSREHGVIDYDVYTVWPGGSFGLEFDTYYPRRGADRSKGNTDSNAEILINDAAENVLSVELIEDTTSERNAIYNKSLTAVTRDTDRISTYGLREYIVDDDRAVSRQQALDQFRATETVKFRLVQTAEIKYGGTFELGDQVSYNSAYFGTTVQHDTVVGVQLSYDADGFEHLEIALGDPEPTMLSKQKQAATGHGSGSAPIPIDAPTDEETLADHDILGVAHADTVTASPVQGDLILANDTPAWGRLAIGTGYLQGDGTTADWGSIDASDLPSIDHGDLTGLDGDDHEQYLLADGSRALAGNLLPDADSSRNIGSSSLYFATVHANRLESDTALVITNTGGIVYVAPNNSNEWAFRSGELRPLSTHDIGNVSNRAGTIYAQHLNLSGNITVSGNVDGVDVSTHTHNYDKATSTGSWVTTGYSAGDRGWLPVYESQDTGSTVVGYAQSTNHKHPDASYSWTYSSTESGSPN